MKEIKSKQTRIITGNNAEDFEAKLNKALGELANKGVSHEITFNMNMGFCAYIVYTATTQIAETKEDEYSLAGEMFTCGDCKYLPEPKDKRVKNVHCTKSGCLRSKDMCACNEFYVALEEATNFLKEE